MLESGTRLAPLSRDAARPLQAWRQDIVTGPEIRSFLSGTAGLSVLLIISVFLTVARPRVSHDPGLRRRFLRILGAAIAGQGMHFAEELATGFHSRFPVLLGLSPWTSAFFVWFNVGWIVLWVLAGFGLRRGLVAALAPVWFLALALFLNGIAHPLMALREGAYFPGLYSSPLVGMLGFLLLRGLRELTHDDPTPTGPSSTKASAGSTSPGITSK